MNYCQLADYHFEQLFNLNIFFSLSYLCIIFSFQDYIQSNQIRFGQKYRLITSYWFLGLSMYSISSVISLLPSIIYLLFFSPNMYHFICEPVYSLFDWRTNHWNCFWIFMFYISKIIELGDTIFILCIDRKLILLQWFHHFTTLWYVFYSLYRRLYSSIWFIFLNVCVHSIMYMYYHLSIHPSRHNWIPPHIITCAQILQMILGLFFIIGDGYLCDHYETRFKNMDYFGLIMYSIYFYLFSQLFVQKYIKDRDVKNK